MKKTNKKYIIACIILAIIGGVGVKLAYDYGYKVASEQAEAKVQKLAEAVENKAKINSMIAEIKVPTELNSDTVEEYLAEIAKAIDKIDDGEIKTLLENYKEKWSDFRVIYASQDNGLINKTVSELKNEAEAAAKKIREVLDARIAE